jgi:hypothetical protein
VVGANHLERGLGRLGPARDRVDHRVDHREVPPERRRVALERLARERAGVRERHGRCLLGHDLGDAPSTVPDADDHRATRRVEIRRAVRVPDRDAVGPRRHGRLWILGATEDAAAHRIDSTKRIAELMSLDLPHSSGDRVRPLQRCNEGLQRVR